MRLLDTLHRWLGGLVGLILALIGLSGTVLLHEDAWIMLPHAGDPLSRDPSKVADAVARMMEQPGPNPKSIILAHDGFGLHQIRYAHGAGAYADQAGAIVIRWSSEWQRPELWLFDLHHHLFAGEVGDTMIGAVALCGLFFVLSGTLLWWRTRRTFAFRPLPKRLSRPAIVRHHRDLGIVVAPLLVLSFATGALMIFRPLTAIFGPGTPAAIAAFNRAPHQVSASPATLSPTLDWRGIVRTAASRFPGAELRVVTLPDARNRLVAVRMRQAGEWVPNGRTQAWFSPATGALAGVRDAREAPAGVAAYNLLYPLHAAKVGGLVYRLVMTASGLGLTLLGSLAVWSFWFKRGRAPARRPVAAAT